MLSAAVVCMALNVFFEARNEPLEGQYAVAFVTANRAAERKRTVCNVVFESKQFSWTTEYAQNGKVLHQYQYMLKGDNWNKALQIADIVINYHPYDFTHGANYFYADYIPIPSYLIKATFVGKWGRHYFYRKEE